jgi:hypothetical protein
VVLSCSARGCVDVLVARVCACGGLGRADDEHAGNGTATELGGYPGSAFVGGASTVAAEVRAGPHLGWPVRVCVWRGRRG